MKGPEPVRVSGLWHLTELRKEKRAVYVPHSYNFKRPTSAAFIMNMPGTIIYMLLTQGMFVYEKPIKP